MVYTPTTGIALVQVSPTAYLLLPPNQLLMPLFASEVFFSTALSKLSTACFDSLRASSNLTPASAFSCESLVSASPAALPSLASYSLPFALASATCEKIRLQCSYSPSSRSHTVSSNFFPALAAHSSPSFCACLPEPESPPCTLFETAAASSSSMLGESLRR